MFKDLLNLKRDIDLLIKSVSPLIGENNQYLYIEHAQKDLLNKQENLPNIQTQGEFQELYNDFESQSEMLKMFRQCLTMINVLKGTLLQEVEEKDKKYAK